MISSNFLSTVAIISSVIICWAFALANVLSIYGAIKNKESISIGHTTFSIVYFLFCIAFTFYMYTGYGSDEPIELPAPSQDGIRELMKDTPAEDLEAASESAESKKPKVLLEVEKNSTEDEDEKFMKTVENALKIKVN